MAVKVARESFAKEEIIDILKRNVALYKNERDFVDYIVNLAMFLIDQQGGGENGHADEPLIQQEYGSLDVDALSGLTPMPVTGFLPLNPPGSMPGHGTPYPQSGPPSGEYVRPESYRPAPQSGVFPLPINPTPVPSQSGMPISTRPTSPPVGTPVAGIPVSPPGRPGTPPGMAPPPPPAARNSSGAMASYPPPGGHQSPMPYQQGPAQAHLQQPGTPPFGTGGPRFSAGGSRFDVESSPLNTPTGGTDTRGAGRYPSGGGSYTPLPAQPPQRPMAPLPPTPSQQNPQAGQQQQQGPSPDSMNSRTKVYKVFRSYSSSGQTSDGVYCPICGTDAGSARKCPNCGHLI